MWNDVIADIENKHLLDYLFILDLTGLKAADLFKLSTSHYTMYYEHQFSFPYLQMLAFSLYV